MDKRFLLFNQDECIGCFSCEVACKQEHRIPADEHWIRILKVGPMRIGEKLTMRYVAARCMHCGKPACMAVCPVGAISKRSDGIVLFSEALCTGCRACMEACPFGAPQYNSEKNVVRVCNLCIERVDKGSMPSCVHHCPTGALYFGKVNAFSATLVERRTKV